jgi:hypothetical protein
VSSALFIIIGIVIMAFFTLAFLSFAIVFAKADKRAAEIHKQSDDRLERMLDEPLGGQIDKRV